MSQIDFADGTVQNWERVSDGVEKIVLRAKPGENRVLLRIATGKSYPTHSHSVPDVYTASSKCLQFVLLP